MAEHIHFHRRSEDEVPETPPQGMTQEQLDFFTEQTHRAVGKAVRRYRNGSLVGFVILLVGLALALADSGRTRAESDRVAVAAREQVVASGKAVAVESCNRDYTDRVDFRSLLERLKESSLASKTQTPAQKALSKSFYDSQLARFALPDCRKSETLLTDDPTANIPVILPYYLGADYAPTVGG